MFRGRKPQLNLVPPPQFMNLTFSSLPAIRKVSLTGMKSHGMKTDGNPNSLPPAVLSKRKEH